MTTRHGTSTAGRTTPRFGPARAPSGPGVLTAVGTVAATLDTASADDPAPAPTEPAPAQPVADTQAAPQPDQPVEATTEPAPQ